MVMNFNGLYPVYYQSLHSKLEVMVPPWSSTPERQLIEFPGTGYSVTTSSANPKLAAQFVAFTVSPTAQKLVAATGQIPVISSVPAQTGAGRQLLAIARSGRYELYPMIDNYMPAEVPPRWATSCQRRLSASSQRAALSRIWKGHTRACPPTSNTRTTISVDDPDGAVDYGTTSAHRTVLVLFVSRPSGR